MHLLTWLRQQIAGLLMAVANDLAPSAPNDIHWTLLRANYQRYEDGSCELDAHIQSEAAKVLGFLGYAMIGDAPNYATAGFKVTARGREEFYEITVQRYGARYKRPSDRIAELEARLSDYEDLHHVAAASPPHRMMPRPQLDLQPPTRT